MKQRTSALSHGDFAECFGKLELNLLKGKQLKPWMVILTGKTRG
jgi:hypothetical protein